MFGLASPKRLRELGVVGMNKRNVVLIARNNPRKLYPLVDNKLKTKLLCGKNNIAVPTLLGICRVQHHTQELADFLTSHERFVIKPAEGSGGKGILVISGKVGDYFVKPSGQKISYQELRNHTSNIISGLYSLGGKPDVAIIEAMVSFTNDFDGFTFEGVPDIRVIVYHGYPVMAMTRLSTHASDGKANLHQGAVGVGIDIATGRALQAVQYGHIVTHHPDTQRLLSELSVPHWKELMTLAARSFEVTGLGYIGADIVIDKERGPLLLELNARPGLAIQMANGKGLDARIKCAEQHFKAQKLSIPERVEFAMQALSQL